MQTFPTSSSIPQSNDFKKVTKSLIYKLNNMGDKGHLCFKPLFTSNQSVKWPFTLTEQSTLVYKDPKAVQNLPDIPILSNLVHIRSLFMVSYAFLKSMKAQKVDLRYLFLTSMILVKEDNWSTVLRSFRKPFCSSASKLLSSTHCVNLSLKILQYSLYDTDASAIPL